MKLTGKAKAQKREARREARKRAKLEAKKARPPGSKPKPARPWAESAPASSLLAQPLSVMAAVADGLDATKERPEHPRRDGLILGIGLPRGRPNPLFALIALACIGNEPLPGSGVMPWDRPMGPG